MGGVLTVCKRHNQHILNPMNTALYFCDYHSCVLYIETDIDIYEVSLVWPKVPREEWKVTNRLLLNVEVSVYNLYIFMGLLTHCCLCGRLDTKLIRGKDHQEANPPSSSYNNFPISVSTPPLMRSFMQQTINPSYTSFKQWGQVLQGGWDPP